MMSKERDKWEGKKLPCLGIKKTKEQVPVDITCHLFFGLKQLLLLSQCLFLNPSAS